MSRVTVLLSVLVLTVQVGCGGDVGSPDDPNSEKELAPSIQVALASGQRSRRQDP